MAVILGRRFSTLYVLSLVIIICASHSDIVCDDANWPPDTISAQYHPARYYGNYHNLCSSSSGIHPNVGCYCTDDGSLHCSVDNFFESLDCKLNCGCHPDDQHQTDAEYLAQIEADLSANEDSVEMQILHEMLEQWAPEEATDYITDAASEPVPHQCKSTCTSVQRQCAYAGDCTCTAPRLTIFFWFGGLCGPSRSAAQALLNQAGKIHGKRTPVTLPLTASNTTRAALNGTATLQANSTGTSDEIHNGVLQLIADGLLPAPCNASYVSYACANSSDGIVHEGPEKWLGALLPVNATQIPPVPRDWLTINGFPANHSDNNMWLISH